MKEEKLRLPINYASLERAVTRLDLDLQKQLMEFLKSEIKRKEKEEQDELRKMI